MKPFFASAVRTWIPAAAVARWVAVTWIIAGLAGPFAGIALAQTARQQSVAPMPDSLTLDQAIRLAVERNRDVRAATLALREAGHQAGEAWSSVMPSIELDASYTRNITPSVSFLPAQIFNPDAAPGEMIRVQFGADNTWNSTIRLEQPLFQARAFLGVGAAGRFQALQEEVLRGATQGVVTRVRVAYYDVLLSQEQERLLESSVQRVRTALHEARAMHRAGLASEYDVLRLEVELANLEPNVRRAHNAVAQSRRVLAVELAMPDLERTVIAGTLIELDLLAFDANSPSNRAVLEVVGRTPGHSLPPVDALVSTAQQERSDLRQLELTRSLRRTELRAEQMEYAPRISLFANYTINAQENGAPNFFGASSLHRSYGRIAGVSVTMPLFTGLREHARIGQRRAVVRTVETQLELARDRAEAQIRSLAERVEESAARAEGQRLTVRQARRGFEIAAAQFREGMSGQLERTDAEVALRQSEFNYAQAVYDYLVARAQLDEAVGRAPGGTTTRIATVDRR